MKAAILVDFAQEFEIAFDVMDAAINRCLRNFTPGFIEVKREQATSGSASYILSQELLGYIGKIHVDKLSDKRTQLFFAGPNFTNRISPRQAKAFFDREAGLEHRPASLFEFGTEQAEELLKHRKEHWEDVVSGLSQRLASERIWPGVKSNEEIEKPSDQETKKASKKGPHKYSNDEKLKALRDWENLDKAKFPINVQDWLIDRFGENGGQPNVPKSTFYGWKKPLKGKP